MDIEDELASATLEHLFALWLPRWRLELVTSEVPPEEIAPAAFSGPHGLRHPVSIERFGIEDPDETSDGHLHASWGMPTEGAERAYEFLIGTLEAGPAELDRRGRALAGYVAGDLSAQCSELLRITVAAEPDGPVLNDELHLVTRAWKTTCRLSLTPASARVPADADADAGHRIACVTALLSDFLRTNNTDEVRFEVTFGTHDVDLDVADPEAAFRAGWADDHWLIAEEGDDDVLWPLDSLEAALAESERNLVEAARAGTLLWEFDDTTPEIPGDELVSWLARDLYGTIVTGIGGVPLLAYAKNFPLDEVLWGEGNSCLLLVGPARTALIYVH
ncbi:hypothetical protein [Actinomadura sp. 9N407]|uniref:hypothetical protein n=1 Tax=Actinomadura sp. 9N407 TaxID=3375154 RepID=UPI0037BD9FF6